MGKKNWQEVNGYLFGNQEAYALQALASGNVCLEIGSYMGKSTVAMAEVAKSVYAVDTFRADPNMEQKQTKDITTLDAFMENIAGYDNIFPLVGKSSEVVPYLACMFDFIFIDGQHTYEQVRQDIFMCLPILKQDGVMAFHDYGYGHHPGVKKAVDEFFDIKEALVMSLAYARKNDYRKG